MKYSDISTYNPPRTSGGGVSMSSLTFLAMPAGLSVEVTAVLPSTAVFTVLIVSQNRWYCPTLRLGVYFVHLTSCHRHCPITSLTRTTQSAEFWAEPRNLGFSAEMVQFLQKNISYEAQHLFTSLVTSTRSISLPA